MDTESRAAIFPQAREVSGIPLHTPIQLSMKIYFKIKQLITSGSKIEALRHSMQIGIPEMQALALQDFAFADQEELHFPPKPLLISHSA